MSIVAARQSPRFCGWTQGCCYLAAALFAIALAGCAQILGLEELEGRQDGGTPADAAAPDAAIVACTDSSECSGTTPICSRTEGTCQACSADNECSASGSDAPFCAADGRCGACAKDVDCADPMRPLCDAQTLTCRGCNAHSECASTVCDIAASACVDPSEIVYVEREGSFGPDCGTQELPCASPDDAVMKVTSERSYMRLTGTFSSRLTLSATRIRVIGEGATLDLTPVDFDPIAGITVNMDAQVLIDGLRVANLSVAGGISCESSQLTLRRVTVDGNEGEGVSASNCALIIEESRITGNSERGVAASGAVGGNLVIERSLIADNYTGGINSFDISGLLIRNNLILRNSNLGEYHGALRLTGTGPNSFVTYNTIVGNRVNENYIGIIACGGAVLSSNIIWGNEFPGTVDQTIDMGCEDVRNNLSDSTLEGKPQNYLGDPAFASASDDDYRLMPGSLAIDLGDPTLANLLDYAGNPRPQGAGPDIGALEAPAP
jgi:hypothetical protein